MKIGILSLGLIGGSLLKVLSETTHEIHATTRNIDTIVAAKKYTKYVSNDIAELKCCDMVFVCSPINKTIEALDSLETIVSKECIVLDCSSVKEFVMKKKRPYNFIGSHPMAGTEFSGFENSFKELFSGAKWVLTPSADIDENIILKAEDIISITGAVPILADAAEHDEAVAMISHMPLLLSQALYESASSNKLALLLAASGFRDMTRLATSNLDMAFDMRRYNQQNIDASFYKLIHSFENLNNSTDKQKFLEIKYSRLKMYSKDGKNILE